MAHSVLPHLFAILLLAGGCAPDSAEPPANATAPAFGIPPGPTPPPPPIIADPLPPAEPEIAPPPATLPDGRTMPDDIAFWLTRAWRCRAAVEHDSVVRPMPGDLSTGEKCIGVDEERDRLLRKYHADTVAVKFLDSYPSGTFLDRIRER